MQQDYFPNCAGMHSILKLVRNLTIDKMRTAIAQKERNIYMCMLATKLCIVSNSTVIKQLYHYGENFFPLLCHFYKTKFLWEQLSMPSSK